MLVEPVGHEGAGDSVFPPRERPHLGDPRLGDVPVVSHVVVVEDHRRGNRCEQPADVGIRPGLPVEARVLLEVGDLLTRRLGRVSLRPDVGGGLRARPRRRRPGRRAATGRPATASCRPEAGVSTPTARRLRTRPGLSAGELVNGGRCGAPTRQEPKTSRDCRSPSRVWIAGAGRPSSGGQTRAPSSVHDVGRGRAGREALDQDERVVVAFHLERRRAMAEHLDLGGACPSRPRPSRWSCPCTEAAGREPVRAIDLSQKRAAAAPALRCGRVARKRSSGGARSRSAC